MDTVRVVASGFRFLESPRWRDDRLWVSDFYAHQVFTIEESGTASATTVTTVAEVSGQPSGLGWLPDGRLLIVSMRDRRLLRLEPDGTLVEHANLAKLASWHLNDLLVDDLGRAYVGNFGFDLMSGAPPKTTNIVLVRPDASTSVVAEGLAFPNGMALLDGGATLVVAESLGNRLSGFAVGPAGQLAGRRDWASFGPTPSGTDLDKALAEVSVVPDGICSAGDGTVWVADAVHHRAIRVAEGGTILDQVDTGDLQAHACALGGADGRTLYLCAAPSFAEHERRDTREAVLLAATV